jgi:hypothetical protein
MQRFLLVMVQLLLLTAHANSQSPAEAAQGFGLFGTWALDCSRSPGPANPYVNFALTPEGAVELRNSFGPDYDEMIYRIVDAKRVSHFRLAMREVLTTDDRIVLDTVTLKAAGKIRNWSSHFADGSGSLVEDGFLPSDEGRETGWMTRCDVMRASGTNSVLDAGRHL